MFPLSAKSRATDLDQASREALFYVFNVFDEATGGALKRGWKEATKPEQLAEWDALPPEQMEQVRQKWGNERLNAYGAQMERIRKELDGVKLNAVAV